MHGLFLRTHDLNPRRCSDRPVAKRLKSIGRGIQRLPSYFYRLARLFLIIGVCLHAGAQEPAQARLTAQPASSPERALSDESAHAEKVPRVPGVSTIWRGLNAGVTFSGVHDSSIGWYNIVTPAVSYTISHHYSADASLSIYPYRLAQNLHRTAANDQRLVVDMGDTGDTLIGLHAGYNPHRVWNTTTASFTLPTGNRLAGLGTGKVTFDFSDHLERYFKQTGFLVDIGAGDSSGLVNNLVTKDYNSLGPLAHFQAGTVVWLPGQTYLQSVVYEQFPFGSQKIYTTVSSPDSTKYTVISGNSASEDNGFTISMGIPLASHLSLSGYYNRSLRRNLDTVSIGVTYVLRDSSWKKRLSLIDRALREAEEGGK